MPGCAMFPPSENPEEKEAISLRSLELIKGQEVKDKNYTVRCELLDVKLLLKK